MGNKSEWTKYLRESIVTYGGHYYTFDLGMLGGNKRERGPGLEREVPKIHE